jgi:hypothetical protein
VGGNGIKPSGSVIDQDSGRQLLNDCPWDYLILFFDIFVCVIYKISLLVANEVK